MKLVRIDVAQLAKRLILKGIPARSCEPVEPGKFLLINDVLVVGSTDSHAKLFAMYTWGYDSTELAAWFNYWVRNPDHALEHGLIRRFPKSVKAAGSLTKDGRAHTWYSLAFDIETPEDLRPEIETLLCNSR